jgi:hypothetical protein
MAARISSYKTAQAILGAVFFVLALLGVVAAQIPSTARRDAARLERLATNVWEWMVEDADFGYPWDRRSLLDAFNFANGARYLNQKIESGQSRSKELSEVVELLLLQSQSVDRSLRSGRAGRTLLRDWDEAKITLDSLARLLASDREPFAGQRDLSRGQENVNNLRTEIKEVRHAGNIFGNDYRIRGTITGRNIVSAGIYHKGRLLKTIPVRLNDRRLTENPFEIRMEAPGGEVTLRVIDNQGFVLEQPIEFPAGGLIPGFK